MAPPPNDDGLSLKTLKIGVRLLLLVQVSVCLMVEIKGLNAADYTTLRNANGILKNNLIQPLDSEENAPNTKETLPTTLTDINALSRVAVGSGYNDFALNEIRHSPTGNSQESASKSTLHAGDNTNDPVGNAAATGTGICHMDIEYKLTKRVLGRCTNLGRSARGCIAGNYLQMFHPACF